MMTYFFVCHKKVEWKLLWSCIGGIERKLVSLNGHNWSISRNCVYYYLHNFNCKWILQWTTNKHVNDLVIFYIKYNSLYQRINVFLFLYLRHTKPPWYSAKTLQLLLLVTDPIFYPHCLSLMVLHLHTHTHTHTNIFIY